VLALVFGLYAKGIRTEIAGFDYAAPKEQKILNAIELDKGLYRVVPLDYSHGIPLWLWPSMNGLYGIDSAAFYSPLANKSYFDITQGLGIVDDSIGIVPPPKDGIYRKIDLLKALNIKYVISSFEFENTSFKPVLNENGLYMYELKGYRPRFIFTGSLSDNTPRKLDIDVKEYRAGYAKVSFRNEKEGFLVFSENNYPGWNAYIDGKRAKIHKYYNVLQAVEVASGEHVVVFEYDPKNLKLLFVVQILTMLGAVISGIYLFTKKRK